MSLSEDLLDHAADLLEPSFNGGDYPYEVNMRRSLSACYYALFHRINQDAARLIAPHVAPEVNHRIQRWFDHAEMRRVCGRFSKPELDQPLRGLLGVVASDDLRSVASAFIELQEDRHSADYDLGFSVTANMVQTKLVLTALAIEAWQRLENSAEANVFILSLLMFKNWEKDRQ